MIITKGCSRLPVANRTWVLSKVCAMEKLSMDIGLFRTIRLHFSKFCHYLSDNGLITNFSCPAKNDTVLLLDNF
ncbi:MAG: hypothetical protein JWQ71_4034 [Pedosphaera sp.]|nr:hypothetical protein [Pedosphaera sp.]